MGDYKDSCVPSCTTWRAGAVVQDATGPLGRAGAPFHDAIMAPLLLVATVALLASCQGAALPDVENLDTVMEIVQEFVKKPESFMDALGARAKRETSPSGFKVFPLAFIGAEVGIKYNSHLNPGEEDMRGGEVYLHIDDLQALIPSAKSKMVKLHAKFSSNVDLEWTDVDSTLLNFEVDYKLEHKSGHGIEAGSFKVAREHTEDSKFVDGEWKFLVKSETVPFVPLPLISPYSPVVPESISNVEFELTSGDILKGLRLEKGFEGKLVNSGVQSWRKHSPRKDPGLQRQHHGYSPHREAPLQRPWFWTEGEGPAEGNYHGWSGDTGGSLRPTGWTLYGLDSDALEEPQI